MGKPANKLVDAPGPTGGAQTDAAAADDLSRAVTLENTAPAERTDFPCSVAQERFWLLDRLDPGNASYNVAVRWRLEGRVLTDVLELAWLKIIERHEILRTVFLEIDGAPVQRVMPHIQFRVNEIDLGNLPPESQQAEGDRIGVIEARAPFDVATGPLIRVTLLRSSPSLAIILVTTHQIVSDGWSIGVMAHEMGVIYEALRRDSAPSLEPLAIQYADYSLWQLEWLRVRGTDAETAYWTRQLAGVKPFKIIADRERPAKPTTNGAIVSRVLPRELTNRAQAMSAERGATLFAAVLAALCATLARYTNETDIVIGTQVSDRDQVELEPMIGQFVNSLILRNNLAGNPRFGELVDQVRETVAQALEFRHIPIERLLGMVKGERSHANSPSISVNFIFQKTFIHNAVYTDFALIDMPSLPAGAIYDLNFFMVERPDGWRFSCQYNTDQFEGATAERLLDYYQNLLESAVSNADRRLAELTLGDPGEARLLLARLNDTRTLYPRDLTLGKLFDTHASRSPGSIAVVCADRQLSYGELHAAANRFAVYLRGQGIGPGARVGISLEPSIELPICLLAVLKTGAAYVPFDPADPPLRRARLIAASRATALIAQTFERPNAAQNPSLKLIDIEAALAFVAPSVHTVAMPSIGSDATACVVFSAGSSEESRRVDLSHRNLANLMYAIAKRTGVGDRDVVVANSPLALDRASFEIFLPLLTGARLVIARDKHLADGRTLLQLLQQTGATVMFGGSSTWSRLLLGGWVGYPALKMFAPATGMNPRLIDQLSALSGELWGLFGHPEAGIWSAVQRIQSKRSCITLGEPLANMSLQVLDSSLQVAPVGVTGTVFIGGDGLADSARAAYRSVGGARLFCTGDMGRLLAGGQIEYLGRNDDRFIHLDRPVDPREIEQALEQHADVAEALVAQTSDASGKESLVAYVVMRRQPAAADAVAALDRHLEDWLPPYLRPASIVMIDALPRTPEGGLDRRSWQTLKGTTALGGDAPRPSGEIEERLAEIWSSMLGLAQVDAGGNFFELGGHSLLAARMLAQVERAFGRRIKLATLFVAPTLREFAAIVAQGDLREFDFRQVVKIQPHGSRRPLIAINNTGIYYGVARCLGPEQPVYSLQLFDPSTTSSAMPQTLEEIAAGYVDLIRRVQPEGPYDLMGWCVAGALSFEIARQLAEDGREVAHLFLIDSWVPGYFDRLPKLRGLIGGYSLRLQLILAEWRQVLSRKKSLVTFLSKRNLFIKLRRLIFGAGASAPKPIDDTATLETYDQWLLAYLQRVTAGYTPRPYHGRVTLLRSSLEPTGWFFHPDAGWAAFTPKGVDVQFVEGNHFTMFQHPGASQMAAHLANAIRS